MSLRRKLLKSTTRAAAALSFALGASAAAPASASLPSPNAPAAQCPHADRPVSKVIKFWRDQTTVVKRDTVRLCTSHEYTLDAENGDKFSIELAAGRRTSFTLRMPSGDIVEGADGVRSWSGTMPEIGTYVLIIGTDVTARYKLTVTMR